MKKFLTKICLAAGLLLLLDLAIVVGSIVAKQDAVGAAFDVSDETRVLFIGNSHTGCTFTESPELRSRVFWKIRAGFASNYVRFLELERRGALDRGAKACVIDCDASSFFGLRRDGILFDFFNSYPFAWRYLDVIPLSAPALALELLLRPGSGGDFQTAAFPEPAGTPNWATRSSKMSPAELEAYLTSSVDGAAELTTCDWDSGEVLPRDWREQVEAMALDMKARCDRHGVRLVLFAAPLASQCPFRTNPVVWQQVSDMAARLRARGIEYRDYRLSCSDDQFVDAHHLMHGPSAAFTGKFCDEVLKILR